MRLIFTDQYASILLLANGLLILLFFYARKKKKQRAMEFGNYDTLKKIAGDNFIKSSNILLFIKLLAITSIIIGISSPELVQEVPGSDADWVIALDSSGSMFTDDIDPTRFEAAQDISQDFVGELGNSSQVGVVSYSGSAEEEIELTNNHEDVQSAIEGVEIGETPGTATGDAIITSSNLLMNSDEDARRIVLVTDGRQNVGTSINESVDFANRNNVSIFTIGIGEANETEDEMDNDADLEGLVEGADDVAAAEFHNLNTTRLNNISERTGGEAVFVSEREGFETAFIDIITDERRINISEYLILFGAFLLVLEWLFKTTNYDVLP